MEVKIQWELQFTQGKEENLQAIVNKPPSHVNNISVVPFHVLMKQGQTPKMLQEIH